MHLAQEKLQLKCYEYIAVYVDDLCIAAESPSAILDIFMTKYHLKVEGDGKLSYHLGTDYFEDPDGTHVSHLKKSIDLLAETYKRLFTKEAPKSHKTPLDKNDHPELDTSEILEGQGRIIPHHGGPTSMASYFGEFLPSCTCSNDVKIQSCSKTTTYGETQKDLCLCL